MKRSASRDLSTRPTARAKVDSGPMVDFHKVLFGKRAIGDVRRLLLSKMDRYTREMLAYSCSPGWKRKPDPFLCRELMLNAASNGFIKVLEWLRDFETPLPKAICEVAAQHGHIEVIKWAASNGVGPSDNTCAAAAEGGQLETLQWLISVGCPCNDGTVCGAARGGHLEILKWALVNGCPGGSFGGHIAIRHGHFQALILLHQAGATERHGICYGAAKAGRLDILQWARLNGYPWDDETARIAAHMGHLEVMQWAIENGCPYDITMLHEDAAKHPNVAQWLYMHLPIEAIDL